MGVRNIPSRSQNVGKSVGEWLTLWVVGIISFLVGLIFGSAKAVKDNVALPEEMSSWLPDVSQWGLDSDEKTDLNKVIKK